MEHIQPLQIDPQLLASHYAKPVPRYTSYPTVPYWSKKPPTKERWLGLVKASASSGISLYIHLPFCENLCTYCGCNKRITKRHEVEAPYVDALLREWAIYRSILPKNKRLNQLHLGGGTPTFFGEKELHRLLEGILTGFKIPQKRDYSVEVHPATTRKSQLATLAKFGFNRISIGVQDFDKEVLQLINRPQTYEQVRQCTSWSRALGFSSINYDLIYGLPGQREEHIAANVARIAELKPDRIAHYGYAHVPWTSPGQRAYGEGDFARGVEKWSLRENANSALLKLGYQRVGFDHYALPHDALARANRSGKLSRNFMGFTTNKSGALIGLGTSAISEIDGVFAQNLKTVEDYQTCINAGVLAHFNGHVASGRDQEVARMIKDVLCKGRTRLPAFDLEYSLATIRRLSDALQERLIQMKGLEIELTAKGKLLARHVALAFDERYWEKQPEQNVFSNGI